MLTSELKFMKSKLVQKIINIFTGKKDNNEKYAKLSFSQDGEDIVLSSYILNDKPYDYKGFYIDIGALHPERFSNTKIFYQKGWRGINIDGTPESMLPFKKQRPDDINIEAVMSDNTEEILYYTFMEPALNSFNKELVKKYLATGYKLKETIKICPQRINHILDKYMPPAQKIDFITIDTEGADEKIIKDIDYDKYSPDYFIIEECEFINSDFAEYKDKSSIYQFLSDKNYIVVAKTMRSIIYKKVTDKNNLNDCK